jgi:transcriptional regulator with XRE-family HTH domain
MNARRELGEFLRSRRGRVRPEAAGLSVVGQRRVPGLRREEIARLAGVSVDYYVRLEQGRGAHPSESVLEAIAGALGLDDAERVHLLDLARPVRHRRRPLRRERVRPEVRLLLEALDRVPAIVLGRRMDVLAWNSLAAALFVDFGSLPEEMRNIPRLVFLADAERLVYSDWNEAASDMVAYLRLAAGRHPDDPGVAELIGELSMRSEEFRRLWARRDVREKSHGTKQLDHPIVGPLTLTWESLAVQGDADLTLITYVAQPGTESETALSLLGSMAKSERRSRHDRIVPGAPQEA